MIIKRPVITKVCSQCNVAKDPDDFYTKPRGYLGVAGQCKQCRCAVSKARQLRVMEYVKAYQRGRNKTFIGRICAMYAGMLKRVRGQDKKARHCVGLYIEPRKKFYNFALRNEHLYSLWRTWVESGYSSLLHPRLARLDKSQGYNISNLTFVSYGGLYENRRKRLEPK